MTDALAPWANLGMLAVIGGIVTLILVGVAATADGAPSTPLARRGVPQAIGALGAIAALVAGIAVAAVAVFDPDDWWLDLSAWGVWIGGEVLVFALMAALFAIDRRLVRH